ncbi:heme ABC transporter permease CcmB [candidate division KSB3 bacterium]|uniref:Heme exporter protein B n=1 Tax=candidate division KSB3 bacterium TaxID=2044937 RepID=A0A2G6KKQ5_9BACT|nr:MAG: heme ABC transporter permease CcmB [candidate division KSB3 bacterium]
MLKKIWPILWKEILSEIRTKEVLIAMCFFAFLVLIVFHFAFFSSVTVKTGVLSGMLWVAFMFSGMLGLNQSFGAEKDRGSLQGLFLCPVDRVVIYVGKVISNFCFMAIMEILILILFTVLFQVRLWPIFGLLSLVILLGTLGFVLAGTMFSAMAVHARARELVLPVILFPIVVPLTIAAVKATEQILSGKGLTDISGWLKILIAFDLVFFLLSYRTFGFVLED